MESNTAANTVIATYSVNSDWLRTVEFGVLNTAHGQLNTIILSMLNGRQYILVGVAEHVIDSLESVCIRNAENRDESVGTHFNRELRDYSWTPLRQSI